MQLVNDNNFKISTDSEYNHTLNHSFDLIIDGQTHFVCCDVFLEISEGETSFSVHCIEDDFYTDFQIDEINDFLTNKLKARCTANL